MNVSPTFVFFPLPVLMTFLFFIVLVLLPFLPGILELFRPKDAAPLFIKMDYLKDPRYFDRSFKDLLNGALEKAGFDPGMKQVSLSKNETVEVSNFKNIADGEKVEHIIYVKENFKTGKEVTLGKEIYAGGSADIGEKNVIRAIACDGNVLISGGTKIIRWIGSDKDIKIDSDCILGVLCACNGKLEINRDCRFKALYGKPVVTYSIQGDFENAEFMDKSAKEGAAYFSPEKINTIENVSMYSREEELIIPPDSSVNRDIISKNNLVLRQGCKIFGSIKAYGDIFLEEDNKVDGNIFAEGSIIVGKNCNVSGNLFSQNVIHLDENVRIGRKDVIKSVIGKKGVEMSANNVVFGYILTEGTGRIL